MGLGFDQIDHLVCPLCCVMKCVVRLSFCFSNKQFLVLVLCLNAYSTNNLIRKFKKVIIMCVRLYIYIYIHTHKYC